MCDDEQEQAKNEAREWRVQAAEALPEPPMIGRIYTAVEPKPKRELTPERRAEIEARKRAARAARETGDRRFAMGLYLLFYA